MTATTLMVQGTASNAGKSTPVVADNSEIAVTQSEQPLAWAGLPDAAAASQHDIREAELNGLADAIEAAIDLDRLP